MLYPWNAYFGLFANVFLAFVQGWATLSPFNAGNFVDAYILLPLFPIIYFGYKILFKTRYWRYNEIDLDVGQRRDVDAAKMEAEVLGDYERSRERRSVWKRLWRNF